ncbi:hypothetical protein WG904_16095 [Pedobacter sp. Du54]|uniref:hypothetical protein n=1 Tax=Pedobacter anseongensis TaxID=3133439 RepID=UPI0030A3CBE9
MKTKIKLWSPLSAFVLIVLCTISVNAFAKTEETGQTYTTEKCEYFLGDGSAIDGTRCYPPDPNGPCDRRSNCHI